MEKDQEEKMKFENVQEGNKEAKRNFDCLKDESEQEEKEMQKHEVEGYKQNTSTSNYDSGGW